jgi:hypothetical protein
MAILPDEAFIANKKTVRISVSMSPTTRIMSLATTHVKQLEVFEQKRLQLLPCVRAALHSSLAAMLKTHRRF